MDQLQQGLEMLKTKCREIVKDIQEDPSKDPLDIYKRFASCDKYRSFAKENHIIFNVLVFSRIWSKRGIDKYFQEIIKGPVDTDERFFAIANAYLHGFEPKLLRKHNIDRDYFYQFYSDQMEQYLKFMKEKAIEVEKKKVEDEEDRLHQDKVNKDLLRKRLGM
jgi:hypothetical protein